MPGGRVAGSSRLQGAFGGASVALSAAAGLLVGLRSVVALDLSGIRPLVQLAALPREGLGIVWTPRVTWPAQLQHVALYRLTGVLVALFLAAMAVAVLNTLVLLAEAGASRRREVAVRSALGAPPRELLRLFLGDVRRLLTLAISLGMLLGFAGGGALRILWPGRLGALSLPEAAGTMIVGLLVLGVLAALAYVWVGLTVGRGARLSAELGAGERATEDPAAIFRRRALSAIQMGTSGAVVLAGVALALGVRAPARGRSGRSPRAAGTAFSTEVIPVTAPGARGSESVAGAPHDGATNTPSRGGRARVGATWRKLLDRLAKVPGMEAESLATPGTLVGLGVRDYATAQCGHCVKGGFPAPLWTVLADHYAVGPGYFKLTGRRVLSGRGLTAADGPSAKKVAVVNRTFASTAFEHGDPLGHLVHVGHDLNQWYEVVGVVEDVAPAAVGKDDIAHPEIYLSALQQPLRHARVLLRGSEAAVRTATAMLGFSGYAPGPPGTIAAVRRKAAAPLLWVGWVGVGLGMLTLLLALHGAHATALQVSRRRIRELAVRRALGATDARILLFVLGGSARGALWGSTLTVFFGSLFVGLLQTAAAGVPSPGPEVYVAMVVMLVGVSVLASLKAAREALAVEPAEVVA